MTKLKSEPVIASTMAKVAVAFAARYGLELTIDQVIVVLGVLEGVLMLVVRQFVTPAKQA